MPRIWDKVVIYPEGCWIWSGAKNKDGYGSVGVGDGKTDLAHRVMWREVEGDIPQGMYVLHACDNPACVRPTHLFLGTQKDNVADCANKGRRNQSRIRKLSEEQREEIRSLYATGSYSLAALGRKFGVTYQTIRHHVAR